MLRKGWPLLREDVDDVVPAGEAHDELAEEQEQAMREREAQGELGVSIHRETE